MSDDNIKGFEPKYELTDDTITITTPNHQEKKVRRIRALKDFSNVKKGDLGGFVESYECLSQLGTCWVYDNAVVCDPNVFGKYNISENARISGNAIISDHATIFGNASVSDNAKIHGFGVKIFDNAVVLENAEISKDAKIHGNAYVFGNARIRDNASVSEYASVCDHATIGGYANIYGEASITGNSYVGGHVCIFDTARIGGDATIDGYVTLCNEAEVGGLSVLNGNSRISSPYDVVTIGPFGHYIGSGDNSKYSYITAFNTCGKGSDILFVFGNTCGKLSDMVDLISDITLPREHKLNIINAIKILIAQ